MKIKIKWKARQQIKTINSEICYKLVLATEKQNNILKVDIKCGKLREKQTSGKNIVLLIIQFKHKIIKRAYVKSRRKKA